MSWITSFCRRNSSAASCILLVLWLRRWLNFRLLCPNRGWELINLCEARVAPDNGRKVGWKSHIALLFCSVVMVSKVTSVAVAEKWQRMKDRRWWKGKREMIVNSEAAVIDILVPLRRRSSHSAELAATLSLLYEVVNVSSIICTSCTQAATLAFIRSRVSGHTVNVNQTFSPAQYSSSGFISCHIISVGAKMLTC